MYEYQAGVLLEATKGCFVVCGVCTKKIVKNIKKYNLTPQERQQSFTHTHTQTHTTTMKAHLPCCCDFINADLLAAS